MATGGKKAKYTGEDKVDEWLLNQVVKHVNHDEIGSFAAELRVERSVYSSIPGTKDKALKVRDLKVPKSVYNNIPGDKDKTFKVTDMQVEESLYFNITTVII